MFCKAFVLALTLSSLQLGSAARINSKAASLKSNSTDSTEGGGLTCSITELAGHVQYGITFSFRPAKKCNRIECEAFKFLDETVDKMMNALPNYKGVEGTCGCFVKAGPLATDADQQFLLSFLQFKKNGQSGKYIYQCTSGMCWERYGQMVTLGMKADHGAIDWPRTQDIESRNHWKAECTGGSSVSNIVAPSVLPTAHEVIKKLQDEGKTEGVEEILEIVNDEEDHEETAEDVEKREAEEREKQRREIFITDVDDVEDTQHHHGIAFVDKPTALRDVVVLSPKHGTCSKNAIKFTRLSADDVQCQLLRTVDDCKLATELLDRRLDNHEGASDVFNDMSPPEDELDHFFSNEFKVKMLKRYPPACFGRITGIGGQMHASWNPLMPNSGNGESAAKKNKHGQVVNRLICGCYDKA